MVPRSQILRLEILKHPASGSFLFHPPPPHRLFRFSRHVLLDYSLTVLSTGMRGDEQVRNRERRTKEREGGRRSRLFCLFCVQTLLRTSMIYDSAPPITARNVFFNHTEFVTVPRSANLPRFIRNVNGFVPIRSISANEQTFGTLRIMYVEINVKGIVNEKFSFSEHFRDLLRNWNQNLLF